MQMLHLSDLHIGAEESQNSEVVRRISYIRDHYPHHLYVITGDIIDNEGNVPSGTRIPAEDAGLFVKELVSRQPVRNHLPKTKKALKNARNILSILPEQQLYFCCGNHDVAVMGNFYDDSYATAFNELLWKPLNKNKPIISLGFDAFSRSPSAIEKVPLLYHINNLPDGTMVRLISLNTCPDTSQNTSPINLASGIVGGSQMNKLKQSFMPEMMIPGITRNIIPTITIMFFHHHPWVHVNWLNWDIQPTGLPDVLLNNWNELKDKIKEENMKIVDADELLATIHGHVDLLMFGHKHKAQRYSTDSAAAFRFGAIASGSSRNDTKTWQITVSGKDTVTVEQVPIV